MIIKVLVFLLQIIFLQVAIASSGDTKLLDARIDLGKRNSLQRGAQTFFNYCVGCHSIKYMRYNRIARDLGLGEDIVKKNFMFASEKVGDNVKIAMGSEEAEKWFGVAPPDLSVISRVRGQDWLYSFLNGFYMDGDRPTGVNNLYFPQTAMPHVLWGLQGYQRLVVNKEDTHDGGGILSNHFETVVEGKLTSSEYKAMTRDLVAFLVYVGEPARLVRYQIGFWVIAFLFLLFIFAYLTKKEYWKDVH